MRIDPQRLMRLAVLIQQGSFRRAAETLGVTQPALSQSIAQIEKEVGVRLIERTPHGVEPTVYGRVLYQHAAVVDRELAQAAQEIQELAFGHKGALAVGTTPGGAATLVALAVCKLLEARPGVDTRIIEETSVKTLVSRLHDRSLDMILCQRPEGTDLNGIRTISLFRTKRVACVRSGHPLANEATLRDLATYPFVCPEEEMGHVFGFRQIFLLNGLALPEVLISNSINMAKEIVLNSDAFALFSDLSVLSERQHGLISSIELEVSTMYWMQLIIRDEQALTELMRWFVREIVDLCGRLSVDVHPEAHRFLK